MKILLFGVSNVGKSTIGELLAKRLGYRYYDLDDEVKRYYQITLEEFVNTGTLESRDIKRGGIIRKILEKKENIAFAITPISYPNSFKKCIQAEDILAIELYDTADHIFSRLVFSDEHDNIYLDNDYKNKHKEYYLGEIQEDLNWYGKIYREMGIRNRFYMNNDSPEKIVDRLIEEYDLVNPKE